MSNAYRRGWNASARWDGISVPGLESPRVTDDYRAGWSDHAAEHAYGCSVSEEARAECEADH